MSAPPATRATRYLTVALRWLLIVAVVFVLTNLAGTYITDHILPQVYTAKATLQVPPGDLEVPTTESKPEPVAFQPEFENTIRSPDFLLSVIKNLDLEQAWAKRLYRSEDQLPDVDALTHMEDVLTFKAKHGTNTLVITAASDVPKEAADIADAVADRYKTMEDIAADQQMNHGNDALRQQIAGQQKVVDDKKAAVEKIRQQLEAQGIEIPGGLGRDEADLEVRQKELLHAEEDSDTRKVLLERVQGLPDDQFISTLNNLGRSQPTIASIQVDSSQTESEIDRLLKTGVKEDDAKIVALRQQDAAKQKQLHDLTAGLRRAMQIDVDIARARVALLQKEVAELTEKVHVDTPNALVPFRNAQRDLEQQQAILDALNVRLIQVLADNPLPESPVRILSRAEIPIAPTHPDKHVAFIVTMVAAGILSLLAASFVEIIFLFVRASSRMEN